MTKLLRPSAVVQRTGLSRASVYLYVNKGLLTRPVKIGERSSAWPDYEIDAINQARIAGKTDADIELLVASLHEQRNR